MINPAAAAKVNRAESDRTAGPEIKKPTAPRQVKEIPDDKTGNFYRLETQANKIDSSYLSTEDDIDLVSIAVEEFDDGADSETEELDESLEQVMRNIRDHTFFGNSCVDLNPVVGSDHQSHRSQSGPTFKITQKPEVADDFIRNFLYSHNLAKSLETFQNEWYEMLQAGKLSSEAIIPVSDVYQMNAELSRTIDRLRSDINDYKDIAAKAQATWGRLRKQRDFHRMHHKRVVQEKNKLLHELKIKQKKLSELDPSLKQLQARYEGAMKDATIQRIEKERLLSHVNELEQRLEKSQRGLSTPSIGSTASNQAVSQDQPAAAVVSATAPVSVATTAEIVSPYLSSVAAFSELPQASISRFKSHQCFKAHDQAISSVKFHPTKRLLATVSDDKTWKLWHFPSCELVMTGEGHSDWISDCDFHPNGQLFATASADRSVKIWDFAQGSSVSTLFDHQNVVWSVAFDPNFGGNSSSIATASMDQTCKIWDVQKAKVKVTLRGHADSVNQVLWRPFSSTVVTCSGDKTLSLWDTRSGHCAVTLYGHLNAVNSVATNAVSDIVASCDADGIVKFWDWRNVKELQTVDAGPYPCNRLAFDPAGSSLAVASDDRTVKVFTLQPNAELPDPKITQTSQVKPRSISLESTVVFSEPTDAVQAVSFDNKANHLVAACSDAYIRIYSS